MFYLYVARLDESVMQHNGFRARNLQWHPGRPCVYVGITAKSPEKRFAQHKAGVKNGRGFVTEYGIELIPELTGPIEAADRKEAERMEKEMAEELKSRKGWAAWWN